MSSKIAFLALFLVLGNTMFTSINDWKAKGIDITDGILRDFTGYDVTVDTSCKTGDLSKAPYNYNGTVMSGYLNVNKGKSALAFIFYGRENTGKDQIKSVPTIVWLNGGPGSSSQLGNLFELGPFRIIESNSKAFDIERNNFAWTKEYNVLFVDQPVGTGLSYADPSFSKAYVTNMA